MTWDSIRQFSLEVTTYCATMTLLKYVCLAVGNAILNITRH